MAQLNALISVYDKSGIEKFARGLVDLGWKIYASGGTAEKLEAAGLEVTDIAELVGGKAILGHRVVTLSREIMAGLLADESDEHTAELESLGLPRIDLVCVDMYPLADCIEAGWDEDEITEQTDIGGPTMLRGGGKGRRIVLSRPEQRAEVLRWLENGKPDETDFRRILAAKAEYEVARYVWESARYLAGDDIEGAGGEIVARTKYGENPQQANAGLYAGYKNEDLLSLTKFKLEKGTELSYNNYADIDRLLQTMTHVAAGFESNYDSVPFIALGAKHGNVCGAAIGATKAAAIKKMLEGDLRAIFGGSVMLNFELDGETASLLLNHMMVGGKRLLDVVVCAGANEDALESLDRKGGKLRVVTNKALAHLHWDSLDKVRRHRYVRGGMLAQDNYTFLMNFSHDQLDQTTKADPQQESDMLLAWAVGCTSNSNTVTIVKDGQLLGNGVGQQDRVTAVELALMRAKNANHQTKNAVAYSDSFFPFPDGPQKLVDAGIKAIFATRGSVNDQEIAGVLQDAGVIFYTIPDSLGRGFFGH